MDRQVKTVYVTSYRGCIYAHAFNRNGIGVTSHFKEHLEPSSLSLIERVMRHEANQEPIDWVTDDLAIGKLAREIGLEIRHDATAERLLEK